MASESGSFGGSGVSEEEYDRRAGILYDSVKDNVQQIAGNMKKCSELLQDLAKDMDDVKKRITEVQEHSFFTKNGASPEEATSQDK